jgi:hypothetical protein
MSPTVVRLQRAVWIGLSGIGLGLSVLLVYAWVEVINNPGLNLIDGYWTGRVPWTPAGVLLVLAGSGLALAAAPLLIGLRGDAVRWILMLVVLVLPLLWWLVALGVLPFPRFSAPDPVTLAYALPESAFIALIVPAVAAAILAMRPPAPDLRVRLKPIDRDGEERGR